MAVTGPYQEIRYDAGNRMEKYWYRGGLKPAKRSLPYYKVEYHSHVIAHDGSFQYAGLADRSWGASFQYSMAGNFHPEITRLYAQAYDRFVSKVHQQTKSSLGVTTAEWRQSLNMMSRRTQQLLDFTVALRKKDFGGVFRALGLAERKWKGKPGKQYAEDVWNRKISKPGSTFANNYLEFIFGWQPLVDDIGKSIDVLQKPIRVNDFVRSRSKSVVDYQSIVPYVPFTQIYQETKHSIDCRVIMMADVSISNPNLYLANSLGFINPVSIAWQVMPFSFIVDWFIPVNKFLGSFTDLVGVELRNPGITRFQHIVETYKLDGHGDSGRGTQNWVESGMLFDRRVPGGFAIPSFVDRLKLLPTEDKHLVGKLFSSTALLVQQLAGRGKAI